MLNLQVLFYRYDKTFIHQEASPFLVIFFPEKHTVIITTEGEITLSAPIDLLLPHQLIAIFDKIAIITYTYV